MNFNQVLLMGRLTRDPEMRSTTGGTPVCEAGLAVNRYFTSNGEQRKETLFIDVVFWNGHATALCSKAKKGTPIFVDGRLELDAWTSQDNQKHSRIRAVVNSFQLLTSKEFVAGETTASEKAEVPEAPVAMTS